MPDPAIPIPDLDATTLRPVRLAAEKASNALSALESYEAINMTTAGEGTTAGLLVLKANCELRCLWDEVDKLTPAAVEYPEGLHAMAALSWFRRIRAECTNAFPAAGDMAGLRKLLSQLKAAMNLLPGQPLAPAEVVDRLELAAMDLGRLVEARGPSEPSPLLPAAANTPAPLPGTAQAPGLSGTSPLPWDGDYDWENLSQLVRRLLRYMHGRPRANLADLCPVVWGNDAADVSESALHSAVYKANTFLRQRERRTLEKVRGESVLRWV